jgi:hypothetical protein
MIGDIIETILDIVFSGFGSGDRSTFGTIVLILVVVAIIVGILWFASILP